VDHRALRIGFIGGGNMAQAIVAGLVRSGHAPGLLQVAEPDAAPRERIRAIDPAIGLTTDNRAVAVASELLVLAVKPQVLPAVLAELGSVGRPPDQLVLSVAAGATIAAIGAGLGGAPAIVRVMPNQPALIGAGMSVLVTDATTPAAVRARAEYVARCTGEALWVDDEGLMDAVTAVSGSGPAYFYLLIEAMESTARELGLPADAARAMVRQTALGAAQSAALPDADAAALRASVTSPGGTTAAALAVMDAAGLRDTLRRAIVAARDRGAELGRGSR
jgi:pyrroline-5-carboxylate reductase